MKLVVQGTLRRAIVPLSLPLQRPLRSRNGIKRIEGPGVRSGSSCGVIFIRVVIKTLVVASLTSRGPRVTWSEEAGLLTKL